MRVLLFFMSVLFVMPSFAKEKYLARKVMKGDYVDNLESGDILLTEQPLVLKQGLPTVMESIRDDDHALTIFRLKGSPCEIWTQNPNKTPRQVIGKGVRWKVVDNQSIYREEDVGDIEAGAPDVTPGREEDDVIPGRKVISDGPGGSNPAKKISGTARRKAYNQIKFQSTNLEDQRQMSMICPLDVKLETLPQFKAFAARVRTDVIRPAGKSERPVQTATGGRP